MKIEIKTIEFLTSHGKNPRGFGYWFFSKTRNIDWDDEASFVAVQGTYSAAKREALREASTCGWEVAYVQP